MVPQSLDMIVGIPQCPQVFSVKRRSGQSDMSIIHEFMPERRNVSATSHNK